MLDKNNKLLDENELLKSEGMRNEVKGSGCGRFIGILLSLILFSFSLECISIWSRRTGLPHNSKIDWLFDFAASILFGSEMSCNEIVGFIGLFGMILAILFFGIGIRKNK